MHDSILVVSNPAIQAICLGCSNSQMTIFSHLLFLFSFWCPVFKRYLMTRFNEEKGLGV